MAGETQTGSRGGSGGGPLMIIRGYRMLQTRANILTLLWVLSIAYGAQLHAAPPSAPKDQVIATEKAFAKTMADRDQEKFSKFISREAIFFSGSQPLRGKAQVTAAWSQYFKASAAPFSWEPAQVEVLDSGTLALSSGPVKDPSGKLIGTFSSIWRLEAPHTWRIVFDKGNEV